MLFVPIGNDTEGATIRSQRHNLQISLNNVLQILVFSFVTLGHINHQIAGTNGIGRQDKVLLTLSVFIIATSCNLGVA